MNLLEAIMTAHPLNRIRDAAAIDDALIAAVVDGFYARVRVDELLGPIFERRVGDWPAHEALLARFWSSVLLLSGTYKGSPMQAHLALEGLSHAHFLRWLSLFEETLAELCTPLQAEAFLSRARRIASAFEAGLGLNGPPFAHPG